ncbi:MAG: hypothetical protein ACRD4E_16270, partial [Bryobacteraceae bacterium]
MEHPCKKCGAEVEDGTPFCPQCRAPQIHVQLAASLGEPAQSDAAADTAAAPFPGLSRPPDFDHARDLHSGLFNQRAAVRAAILAGLL